MTNSSPSLFSRLSEQQLLTYRAIFAHPTVHTLPWRDVHALFSALGQVTAEANGNLKLTFEGKTLVLRAPAGKEVTGADLAALRAFLGKADQSPAPVAAGSWLVVINHHEARVFHDLTPGAVTQLRVKPIPSEHSPHAAHTRDFSPGREKPGAAGFFGPLAQALAGAERILVCGGGKGAGSEMEQFISWVNRHHPALATRIAGTMVLDEHHLTDAQLLGKARDFYTHATAATQT